MNSSRIKGSQSTVIFAAAIVAVAGAALLAARRRRRRGTNSKALATLSDSELTKRFQQATETSRTLTNLAHGDKLLLYGLYKQATVGDVNEDNEPSRFQVVEHAKFEGWLKFKGMPCEAAMLSYIQVVQEFSSPTHPMEYETEELDMFNAMGARPSTLASQQEEENDDSTITPLQRAAQDGNLKDIKQVLENTADDDTPTTVNTADESGQTALHFAADRGHAEIVQTLLEAGANANAADLEGISVLQAAVIAGHSKVAAILLKYGANPNQVDMDGDSPISCARDDGSDEMKKLFRISSESVLEMTVETTDSTEFSA